MLKPAMRRVPLYPNTMIRRGAEVGQPSGKSTWGKGGHPVHRKGLGLRQ